MNLDPKRLVRIDAHIHPRTSSRCYPSDLNKTVDALASRLHTDDPDSFAIGVLTEFADYRFRDTLLKAIEGVNGYDYIPNEVGIFVPSKRLLLINGQENPMVEIMYPGGRLHLQSFPWPRNVRPTPNIDFKSYMTEIKVVQALLNIDHPTFIEGLLANDKIDDFLLDSVLVNAAVFEVYNGAAALFPGNNARAEAYFYENIDQVPGVNHITPIAVSDSHSHRRMGTSYTNLPFPSVDPEDMTTDDIREYLSEGLRVSREEGLGYHKNNGIVDVITGVLTDTAIHGAKVKELGPINDHLAPRAEGTFLERWIHHIPAETRGPTRYSQN